MEQIHPTSKARIVTSSWYTQIPSDHIRIGISRGVPRRMAAGYRIYRKLAPGSWFNSVSPEVYREKFYAEILAPLDPNQVVKDIEALAGGKVAVLCCYEAPNDQSAWCHRGLVSLWLKETIGLDVPELGMTGCGCDHPKLHAAQRAAAA